jgi:hypothetical protein
MKVIIYKQDGGRLAIVQPTEEALSIYGIHAIALKDVPMGKSFKIIEASELPSDRGNRDEWTIDDAELTDGIGAGPLFLQTQQELN